MSDFRPNTEYFGGYAHIKTNFSSIPHKYKIVNAVESNTYCDVPIRYDSEPRIHEEMVMVLNVIHCGIDETKVIRVAAKDCDKITTPAEIHGIKKGEWENRPLCGNSNCRCSICGNVWNVHANMRGEVMQKFCPSCGADMRGEYDEAR